jgi:carbohydrate-binding DOMON domain-containing protein
MDWLVGGLIEANPVLAGVALAVVALLALAYLARRSRR